MDTWKQVRIGIDLSVKERFCTSDVLAGEHHLIRDKKIIITNAAMEIIDNPTFTIAPNENVLDLATVSNTELGFEKGAYYKDVCWQVWELGLRLCPIEVGPQLRLQYKDQPLGERLVIATEPIKCWLGRMLLFTVWRDTGEVWRLEKGYDDLFRLDAHDGNCHNNQNGFWPADTRWVLWK